MRSWKKRVSIFLWAGLALGPARAATDSVPADWVQQDVAGQFSFSHPADLQAAGSLPDDPPYLYTGEWDSASMVLWYDFGTNVVGVESTAGGLPPHHHEKWISMAGRDVEEFSYFQDSVPVHGIFVPHVATTDHGWAQLTMRIRLQDPDAAEKAQMILRSVRFPNSEVNRSAVHIDELMQTLLHDDDDEKKKAAAVRLEEIGTPALSFLTDALHEGANSYQKGDAAMPLIIEALAESHNARVIPAIIDAFAFEDGDLDAVIQTSLLRFGPEAVTPLNAALESPNTRTRQGAKAALEVLQNQSPQ